MARGGLGFNSRCRRALSSGIRPSPEHTRRAVYQEPGDPCMSAENPYEVKVKKPHHDEWGVLTKILTQNHYLPLLPTHKDDIELAIHYLEHETSELSEQLVPEGHESECPKAVKTQLLHVLQLVASLRNACNQIRAQTGQ